MQEQTEVIQSHHNPNVSNLGQGEDQHRNKRGLNLVAVKRMVV
jgi:hypothetical protein